MSKRAGLIRSFSRKGSFRVKKKTSDCKLKVEDATPESKEEEKRFAKNDDLVGVLSPPDHLLQILSHPISAQYFHYYVTKKFSSETLSFWVAVEHFRHLLKQDDSIAFAYGKEIRDTYLDRFSGKEVNLEGQHDINLQEVNSRSFIPLQRAAWLLLVNSDYQKYITSNEYKEYLDGKPINRLNRSVTSERLEEVLQRGILFTPHQSECMEPLVSPTTSQDENVDDDTTLRAIVAEDENHSEEGKETWRASRMCSFGCSDGTESIEDGIKSVEELFINEGSGEETPFPAIEDAFATSAELGERKPLQPHEECSHSETSSCVDKSGSKEAISEEQDSVTSEQSKEGEKTRVSSWIRGSYEDSFEEEEEGGDTNDVGEEALQKGEDRHVLQYSDADSSLDSFIHHQRMTIQKKGVSIGEEEESPEIAEQESEIDNDRRTVSVEEVNTKEESIHSDGCVEKIEEGKVQECVDKSSEKSDLREGKEEESLVDVREQKEEETEEVTEQNSGKPLERSLQEEKIEEKKDQSKEKANLPPAIDWNAVDSRICDIKARRDALLSQHVKQMNNRKHMQSNA